MIIHDISEWRIDFYLKQEAMLRKGTQLHALAHCYVCYYADILVVPKYFLGIPLKLQFIFVIILYFAYHLYTSIRPC